MQSCNIPPVRLAAILLAGLALALPAAPAAMAVPTLEKEILVPASGDSDGTLSPDDRTARKKKEKETKDGGEAKKAGDQNGPAKSKEKSFEEVIKEFEVHEGLFTLYTKDEKAYLEIKPDQYDKLHLMTLTRVGGIGQYFPLLGNQQMWNAPVEFRKIGKNVQLLLKNVFYRSHGDKGLKRAVERSFSDSLFGSSKLASAPHPERKSDLIDLSELLIRDAGAVGQYTQDVLKSAYKMDEKNSYLGRLRAFPLNVEIETVLHFENPTPKIPMPTLVDARSMFIRYNYSLSALPEDDDFVPRLADDRVGHFAAPYADFADESGYAPYNRYVTRWKLEKADPLVEVSKVKEPITFYLDQSVPEKYRAAITEGILVWNDAFERIGLKEALAVKPAPTDPDYDSADIRYTTIRWFMDEAGAFAIGPSYANPFTGQIYDADIGFSESMIRFARNEYREQTDPLAMFAAAAQEANDAARHGWSPGAMQRGPVGMVSVQIAQCSFGSQLAERAAFGHALLTARGMRPGSPEEDAYVREFLVAGTVHEVGHTLGLRHNFRASTLLANGDLHDEAKTTATGLTGSVMDYTAVNLAPEGVQQGQYYQTTLGPYDYWAIEYAYKLTGAERPRDELDELGRIASRAAERELAYATDEDAMGFVAAPIGMDPRSQLWDLGADPIGYYAVRVKLAREIWDSLPGNVTREGEGYQLARRAFNRALSEYFPAITSVTKHVGGVMHNRHHVGDPGGSPPYVPVPAAEQRRALEWLDTYLFGPDAFAFKPEVVNALAAERFGRTSWFVVLPRLDYPIHNTVLAMQNLALARLYHPALLDRVVDMEAKAADGGYVDMAEIFATLRDGIWSEVKAGGGTPSIDSFRRALQRRHLEYLVPLATREVELAPAEATTLARYDLMQLKERIGAALNASGMGLATRAHLAESKAVIERALEASFVRGI